MAVGIASVVLLLSAPDSQHWRTHKGGQSSDKQCETLLRPFDMQVGSDENHTKSRTIEKDRYIELCQQIRSAKGAEDSAYWAWWQMLTGFGGLLLVGVGAYYARRAAIWAEVAARAAQRSAKEARASTEASEKSALHASRQADLAEVAFRAIERPYMFMILDERHSPPLETDFDGASTTYEARPTISFHFSNYGKTPAIVSKISYAYRITEDVAPDDVGILAVAGHDFTVIEPGKCTRTFSAKLSPRLKIESFAAIKAGNTFIFFYGIIVYEDAMGNSYATEFCFRYDGTKRKLERHIDRNRRT